MCPGWRALSVDVIDDVQYSDPSVFGYLVMHEAQRPEGISPGLHWKWCVDATDPLAAPALVHAHPFLPADLFTRFITKGPSAPAETDEEPAVAELRRSLARSPSLSPSSVSGGHRHL